jgi:hypothetical protein
MSLHPSLVGKELELVLFFLYVCEFVWSTSRKFLVSRSPKKKTRSHLLQSLQPPRSHDFVWCVFIDAKGETFRLNITVTLI